MADVSETFLQQLWQMYLSAAKGLGGSLICSECRTEIPCSEENGARYLRDGWPRCCGHTMMLKTERKP